jgi:hypothetical protein
LFVDFHFNPEALKTDLRRPDRIFTQIFDPFVIGWYEKILPAADILGIFFIEYYCHFAPLLVFIIWLRKPPAFSGKAAARIFNYMQANRSR